MIARTLAWLSDTPKYETGMRAFDIHFRTPQGDERTAVLTRGDQEIGKQIGTFLFTNHPEATDYTFQEFDYLDFQKRTVVARAVDGGILHATMQSRMMGSTELFEN
jgi:hypothetical protein